MSLKHYCCAVCSYEFYAESPPKTCGMCESPFSDYWEIRESIAPVSNWTEDEWSAAMRYADEHAALVGCNSLGRIPGCPRCGAPLLDVERSDWHCCPACGLEMEPAHANSPLPLSPAEIEDLAQRHALCTINPRDERNPLRNTP